MSLHPRGIIRSSFCYCVYCKKNYDYLNSTQHTIIIYVRYTTHTRAARVHIHLGSSVWIIYFIFGKIIIYFIFKRELIYTLSLTILPTMVIISQYMSLPYTQFATRLEERSIDDLMFATTTSPLTIFMLSIIILAEHQTKNSSSTILH
jgi:hypothetical protein